MWTSGTTWKLCYCTKILLVRDTNWISRQNLQLSFETVLICWMFRTETLIVPYIKYVDKLRLYRLPQIKFVFSRSFKANVS
jgi:hypothetical protein